MFASSIKHRSAKVWHKITIRVDSRLSEAVAAYVRELTGTGLEISPDENRQLNTSRIFPEETVTAYIPIPPDEPGRGAAEKQIGDLRQCLAQVCHFFPDCPAPVLKTETIAEVDWGEKWKSFFTTLQVTPTLAIRPSWEAAAAKESRGYVIEMDPGLAFGTGHHASTQLALLLLEELFQHKGKKLEKILDVGTGSGILAMACGLYGAKEVLALDNDPDALETAKQNILNNRLDSRITVSSQKVSSLKTGFELVVANITHDILAELAQLLASHIKPQGFLVLSGILKGDQEHSIGAIYAKQGLTYVKKLSKDEWVALLFQKT